MANLLEHSALVVIVLVLLQSTPLLRSKVGIGPIGLVAAQNSQDQSMDQQDDSHLGDPNLVNPQNRQGYGKNVPTQVLKKEQTNRPTSPNATAKQLPVPTIGEQTLQAAFQLGVLVAVSLLVGIIFFVNVGIEMAFEALCNKMEEIFGRHKMSDIEEQDPAALVGTFKRYK
ncbi:uncharacterized protein LOC131893188 [Tigriopus californicus]|uniref:uncharacterized protein LOC131893188 n=1 Tax=Tigriopus californicus TaxID=6832 RepID=UPI0027DA7468|nr:uncharacterized protein LOC131893188 [Tigriopus californicus]